MAPKREGEMTAQYTSLMAQAKEHEKSGRIDQAVADMRSALSLIPVEDLALRAAGTSEMTSLLMRINAVRERDSSIDALVEEALTESSIESGTSHSLTDILRKRIGCAERAALLSRDEAVASRLAASVSVADKALLVRRIVAVLMAIRIENSSLDSNDSSTNVQLKNDLCVALIALLTNMARFPAAANAMADELECTQSALLFLVPLHPRSLLLATRSLDLIAILAPSMQSPAFMEHPISENVISLLSDSLKVGCPDTLRLTSLNTLIKITDTLATSLAVLRHPVLLTELLKLSSYGAAEDLQALSAADVSSSPSAALRNVVPVAIARFLDPISNEKNQPHVTEVKSIFSNCIIRFLESTRNEERTQGLMSLTSLFTANPSFASPILLRESVIPEILDMLEFETDSVQEATLHMLSAACADQACRKLISSAECSKVLMQFWKGERKASDAVKSAAAGVLVKVTFVDKEMEKSVFADRALVDGFINALKRSSGGEGARGAADAANAVESLAYLTVRGSVKEVIVKDAALVKALIAMLKKDDKSIQYGVVTIFTNLTALRRRLSEEEEQLMKLKEVSGEAVMKADPLDDDKQVEARGIKLVAAGLVSPLCAISASATVSLSAAIAQLFLNLCNDKRNRGKIVQDGGVKALSLIIQKLVSPTESPAYLIAVQAIAKIAITTDPNLAFTPVSRALDLVRPLVHLLNSDSSLQNFEGLMALTNLASYSDSVRARIVSAQGVKAMEYLQFNDNTLVRRAATESLCNMMFEPSVFDSYVTSKMGEGRLSMMVALCDVDDYETRRAAAGALAILSSSPDACRLIIGDTARGVDMILGLLFHEEEHANPELLHRGVEICKNVAAVGGTLAQRLESVGIVKVLRGVALHPMKEIAMGAVEALQNLQKAGVQVLSKPQSTVRVVGSKGPAAARAAGPKIEEID
ncbi:hypothetical protein HDU77_008684 [Chytriomyces hyalinus]|nr:hypothetical protein HDU77_008684 [Chytriomyces hyalinus]